MSELQLNVPVAFIIFNRLETARQVFNAIALAKPAKLFVIADGPRPEKTGEDQICQSVRDIIKSVDWECQVLTNFSEANLGCKKRVSSGLDWVFSLVEEAIILEDDCLPDQSFFGYCQELLARYKDDSRIAMICGSNPNPQQSKTSDSFHFSRYPLIWGWATWRRTWRNYDVKMLAWPLIRKSGALFDILGDEKASLYWQDLFDAVYADRIDTWDYQFVFSCFIQYQLAICPSHNLIKNIGFGEGATHTTDDSNALANQPTRALNLPLNVPGFVVRNTKADRSLEKLYFSKPNVLQRVRRRLRKLMGIS